MTTPELITYTIYDHPSDFPDHWVVRGFNIYPGMLEPADVVFLCESLEAARAQVEHLAPGLACLARSPSDGPAIVETWL